MDPNCDPGTHRGRARGRKRGPGRQARVHVQPPAHGRGLLHERRLGDAPTTPRRGTEVHESNKVIVKVVLEARLSLSKVQEIKGTRHRLHLLALTGAVGQTVLYQITAKNTGNVPLALSEFTDIYCDEDTVSGGLRPGGTLAPGDSTTYSCSPSSPKSPKTATPTRTSRASAGTAIGRRAVWKSPATWSKSRSSPRRRRARSTPTRRAPPEQRLGHRLDGHASAAPARPDRRARRATPAAARSARKAPRNTTTR